MGADEKMACWRRVPPLDFRRSARQGLPGEHLHAAEALGHVHVGPVLSSSWSRLSTCTPGRGTSKSHLRQA